MYLWIKLLVRIIFTLLDILFYFCHYCAVSASHLPEEKNGIKLFSKDGGLTKSNIDELIVLAQEEARHWYDIMGILPPSSGNAGVLCSEMVRVQVYVS